jgi:FtsZ-interacting cell division protein ZipA
MPPLHPSLLLGALCALALSCPANMVAQNAASGTWAQTSGPDRSIALAPSEELPDSPGVMWAKSQNVPQQGPPTQSTSSQSDSSTTEKQDSHATNKQDEKPQRPVGTAAAEGPRVTGVTAAQPAGAAIAPAKQRRVRTVVLRVGAILGAGAAIGTVVALTAATPSKPPGAH